MAKKDNSHLIDVHNTKRCWSCNTHMQLRYDRCPDCKVKVGKVNEHGVARKPVDWKNYFLGIAGAVAFGVFVWWAFIR